MFRKFSWAHIVFTFCLTSMFWLVYEIGERGVNASETGTGGYTTVVEFVAIPIIVTLLVGSAVFIVRDRVR